LHTLKVGKIVKSPTTINLANSFPFRLINTLRQIQYYYYISIKINSKKHMTQTSIHPQLKEQVDAFVNSLKQQTGENLLSVAIYGGAAKTNFTFGKSNVNLLLVFESVDLKVLDAISVTVQKAMSDFHLSPFILTESEIKPSADVFAVKLFDIQKHHQLVYGKDFLNSLHFEKNHLRFISEQEMRNQLTRMKMFYINNFNIPEALSKKLMSGITTLLINANIFLFVKHGVHLSSRTETIDFLLKEKDASEGLHKLLDMKKANADYTADQIKSGYDLLMIEFHKLIKAFNNL
jgi:hypothetical protein